MLSRWTSAMRPSSPSPHRWTLPSPRMGPLWLTWRRRSKSRNATVTFQVSFKFVSYTTSVPSLVYLPLLRTSLQNFCVALCGCVLDDYILIQIVDCRIYTINFPHSFYFPRVLTSKRQSDFRPVDVDQLEFGINPFHPHCKIICSRNFYSLLIFQFFKTWTWLLCQIHILFHINIKTTFWRKKSIKHFIKIINLGAKNGPVGRNALRWVRLHGVWCAVRFRVNMTVSSVKIFINLFQANHLHATAGVSDLVVWVLLVFFLVDGCHVDCDKAFWF